MKTITLLLFILLIFLQFTCYCQTEKELSNNEICEIKATGFLNSLLGEDFVKENLVYFGIFSHSYNIVCFQINNKNCLERNIVPVYLNKQNIDFAHSNINRKTISECDTSKLLLNKNDAILIAKQSILNLDKTKYKVTFVFWGGNIDGPRWNVETGEESNGYGSGTTVSVNAKTGKFEVSNWVSQP